MSHLPPSTLSDDELIERSQKFIDVERYLEAARFLRHVQDTTKLTTKLRHALHWADEMESVLHSETSETFEEEGWKKQGEAHADYDFIVYYKVNSNNLLTIRIDLVLESSMLIPLLSVLNESNLYSDWMPSWHHPRLGLRHSSKLHELGRGNQIILVRVDIPFPFHTREVIQHAVAIDAIEEYSAIAILVKNMPSGYHDKGIDIPEPNKGIVRIDLDCSFVIQACPDDHEVLKHSKRTYPAEDHKVLITIQQTIDAHVSYVPLTLINFVTRQVIGQMVKNLVDVAAEVKSEKRQKHVQAIETNRELYDWISERVEVMFAMFDKEQQKQEQSK